MKYLMHGFLLAITIHISILQASPVCDSKDCGSIKKSTKENDNFKFQSNLLEYHNAPSLVSIRFFGSQSSDQEKAIDLEDQIDADRVSDSKPKPKPEPEGARKKGYFKLGRFNILKSAIVPGWTQYDFEEKVKAPLFFFSFYGTAIYLWHTQKVYEKQQDDYTNHTNYMWGYKDYAAPTLLGYMKSNKMFSEASETAHRAENLSILLVTIYVVNVIDAIFFCNEKPGKASMYPMEKKEGLTFNSFTSRSLPGQRLESMYYLNYTSRF